MEGEGKGKGMGGEKGRGKGKGNASYRYFFFPTSSLDADRSSGPHIAIILRVPSSACGSVGWSVRRDCELCSNG